MKLEKILNDLERLTPLTLILLGTGIIGTLPGLILQKGTGFGALFCLVCTSLSLSNLSFSYFVRSLYLKSQNPNNLFSLSRKCLNIGFFASFIGGLFGAFSSMYFFALIVVTTIYVIALPLIFFGIIGINRYEYNFNTNYYQNLYPG